MTTNAPQNRQPGTSSRRLDQAAALLAVRTDWVYDSVRAGKMPCIRVGPYIRSLDRANSTVDRGCDSGPLAIDQIAVGLGDRLRDGEFAEASQLATQNRL